MSETQIEMISGSGLENAIVTGCILQPRRNKFEVELGVKYDTQNGLSIGRFDLTLGQARTIVMDVENARGDGNTLEMSRTHVFGYIVNPLKEYAGLKYERSYRPRDKRPTSEQKKFAENFFNAMCESVPGIYDKG